ncbi:hypothetical protein BpHYR1_031718 [Brachionus plicatilis]|uniref:Uncharacterized protein n=1 Tax=Brachionus plicatilis TaxID=10195 RepID=A0A3M7PBL0_BRAPC|nr:hypothetical protein BpHYR1_031718 [Brachionus plicatilis]
MVSIKNGCEIEANFIFSLAPFQHSFKIHSKYLKKIIGRSFKFGEQFNFLNVTGSEEIRFRITTPI